MIETITKRSLPDEFSGTCETKGVMSEIQNRFIEVSPEQTKWIVNNKFRFSGLMQIMARLMPGTFKKKSYIYMELFKAFAEKSSQSGK
jgi:hypothetical protein